MRKPFAKSDRISGIDIPRRRFTRWAVVYFIVFVGAPVLGLALVLDLLSYLVFRHVFGVCYGVLCLAG